MKARRIGSVNFAKNHLRSLTINATQTSVLSPPKKTALADNEEDDRTGGLPKVRRKRRIFRAGKRGKKVGFIGKKSAKTAPAKSAKGASSLLKGLRKTSVGKREALSVVGKTSAGVRSSVTHNLLKAVVKVFSLIRRIFALLAVSKGAIVAVLVVCALCMLLLLLSFIPTFSDPQSVTYVPRQMGDDYPYKAMASHWHSPNPDTGYYYGNCTDFAIWRVNRDAGVLHKPWKFVDGNFTPKGGNGGQWGNPGNMPGWVQTVNPVPGDIISYKPGTLGASPKYGHVAYIAKVTDTMLTIENYGRGKYFVTHYSKAMIVEDAESHFLTIMHNPKNKPVSVHGGVAIPVADLPKDRATLVSFAGSKVGLPYVFGQAGPNSYDCSGLIMMAYRQIGISLPHDATAICQKGKSIEADQAQPGDIFCEPGHVGMYVGGGQVVEAANPRRGVIKDAERRDMKFERLIQGGN